MSPRREAGLSPHISGCVDAKPSSLRVGRSVILVRATYLGDPRLAYFKMVTSDPADRERSLGLEAFGLLHRSSEPEEVC